MNKKEPSNVFSTGGGGNVFEVSIQTAFVINAMLNGRMPSLPAGRIDSIRFQARSATDDLLLNMTADSGSKHKLLAQIKHKLTFTENDEKFSDVVKALWIDFQDTENFNRENDRLLIVTGDTSSKFRNHIVPVLDWANAKQSSEEFQQELETGNQKKAVYEVFKSVIDSIETDKEKTGDEEVWRFLQCVHAVDYDFASDSSSHLSYFKSIIDLSKRDDVVATADEIWGVIYSYVSKGNSKGATLTSEQLHSTFDYFNNGTRITKSDSIKKLQNESNVLFDRLQNTIGTAHVDRGAIYSEIKPIFNESQVVVLSGDAGAGKSAFAKDMLLQLKDSHILAFAADQFQRSRLGVTLSEMGVDEDLTQVFARLALLKNQIIYVDSMEKLAEGPADAFRELISILKKNRQIKLVATCRDYALQPLIFEYLSDFKGTAYHRIPNFTSDELDQVVKVCPELKPILENPKLTNLLNRPKYLAFAQILVSQTSLKLEEIDQATFLDELWNKIIKETAITRGNIHEKRAKVFIEVAVRRARKMTLFADAADLDDEALSKLTEDGILFKQDDQYAPAHDILEDWGLIRYVSRIHRNVEGNADFFNALGTTPALRRGFRLWLEDEILRKEANAYDFIQNVLFADEIPTHWKDEIIVAVLNSGFCDKFLADNQEKLVQHDANLFSRFLHLLRVACKDLREFPIGPGWDAAIRFIDSNQDSLTTHDLLITAILLDWQKKIGGVYDPLPIESTKVAKTALAIIKSNIENYSSHSGSSRTNRDTESLIKLFFRLTEVIKEDVEGFLNEAHSALKEKSERGWRKRGFYRKVIEYSLSGLWSGTVSKYLPELLIEIAKYHWVEQPPEEAEGKRGILRHIQSESRMGIEHYFGIQEYGIAQYNPPSARQTFVSNLLLYHPQSALLFIVEFINEATEKFASSSFGKEDDCKLIEITVNGKLVTKQWGSQTLWSMYRGGGKASPDLLQSILRALENYLYNLCSINQDWAVKQLDIYLDFLIKASKSVSITSVLASISMAFPKLFDDKLLYFISNIDFYWWDSNRWMTDQQPGLYFEPFTVEQVIFNQENKESDNWEHRKKFYRGLNQFVLDYQFNIRKVNNQIFKELDRLKEIVEEEDSASRKILNEIDVRNWKPSEYDESIGGFVIQPEYDEDIQEMVESSAPELEESNKAARLAKWIKSVNEEKEDNPRFENWEECHDNYRVKSYESGGFFNHMFDVPGTLACIGIRHFRSFLSKDQLNWCIDTIMRIAKTFKTTREGYETPNFSTSIFDNQPVLSILPELLGDKEIIESIGSELKPMIFKLLLRMTTDHEKKELITSFKEHAWLHDKGFAELCFNGLVEYASFDAQDRPRSHYYDEEARLEIQKQENVLLEKILSGDYRVFGDFSGLNYENFSHWYLEVALRILSIGQDGNLSILFLSSLYKAHSQSFENEGRGYSSRSYYSLTSYISQACAEYFTIFPIEKSISLVDVIIDSVIPLDGIENYKVLRDKYELAESVFKYTIIHVDSNWDNDSGTEIVNNFWGLWDYLFCQIVEKETWTFTSIFLLKLDWNYNTEHWIPLESGVDLMTKRIKELPSYNVNDLIRLIERPGLKLLAPHGINWIADKAFDAIGVCRENIDFDLGERFIEKCFRQYGQAIKSDKTLLNSFLLLLDEMVKSGSSKAYLIRENILLYKISAS